MKKSKNVYFYPRAKSRRFVFDKTVGGKRICRRFDTLEKALCFAEKFRNEIFSAGAGGLFIGAEDRVAIKKVREICGAGVDLVEVAEFYARHCRGRAGAAQAVSVDVAAADFVFWLKEAGRSKRHVDTVKSALKKFSARFGSRGVASIGRDDLLGWLGSERVCSRTKLNLLGSVLNFLRWCESAKGWVLSVPSIDARLLPRAQKNPVEIWTAAQAEAAVRHLEARERVYLPHYALRLFAGLRTSEAQKIPRSRVVSQLLEKLCV